MSGCGCEGECCGEGAGGVGGELEGGEVLVRGREGGHGDGSVGVEVERERRE